jgi:hypothetical protein
MLGDAQYVLPFRCCLELFLGRFVHLLLGEVLLDLLLVFVAE